MCYSEAVLGSCRLCLQIILISFQSREKRAKEKKDQKKKKKRIFLDPVVCQVWGG